MGGLYSRIKTWVATEDVEYDDLNAEFDNILTNFTPQMMDDYSITVSQMQTVVDPGEVGTESLATTLAGELSRMRFILREITGEDYWYETPVSSLIGISNALGTGIQNNRLTSGRKRSDVSATLSAQPIFLVPNGAARTIKLDGTPINFVYYVNGTQYTISTDTTLAGLTAAPASNNTCLINDTTASDQYWTKYMGENGTDIVVDTMGTEISALVGKYAAFKIAGTTDEYFIAHVTSTTSLTKAYRGYFFDSSDNPIPRAAYANNDVITLMKLSWIFAKSDLDLDVTYTNPVWGADEPSSPAFGDYWFDTEESKWKKYSGVSFSDANATLVGICIQDTTNTVGARSFEFFLNYTDANTFELVANSNTVASTRLPGQANVWGNNVKSEHNVISWDMTTDLDSGITEAASTYYYFYLTERGDRVISDIRPHDRRADLGGYYHPHQAWRAIGWAFNNGSSNLTEVRSYYQPIVVSNVRASAATSHILMRDDVITLSGASSTHYLPSAAYYAGKTITVVHGGTSLTQIYTIDGYGAETIAGASTYPLYTNGEAVTLLSNGTAWIVVGHFASTVWTDGGVMVITGTTSAPTSATTRQVDRVMWRRQGTDVFIRGEYQATSATGAAAGSGDYLFAIPSNMTIDTTMVTASTGIGSPYLWASNVGSARVSSNGSFADGSVSVYDTTNLRLHVGTTSTLATVASGFLAINVNNQVYAYEARLPISGWKP